MTNTDPTAGFAAAVVAAFVEEAAELVRRVERAVGGLGDATDTGRAGARLEVLRALHTLKGAAASAGADAVTSAVHGLETELRSTDAQGPLDSTRIDGLFKRVEEVEELVLKVARAATTAPSLGSPVSPMAQPAAPPGENGATVPNAARSAATEHLRVSPERVDALHTLAGELVVTRLQHHALTRSLTGLRERLDELTSSFRGLSSQVERARPELAPGRWAHLGASRDAFGAGLAAFSREFSQIAKELPMLEAQSATVSTTLEDGIRELRLMPLGPFFEAFGRALRETARVCGKEVRLAIRAEGAEVDRSVLVRLKEPLLHLVRNAVVHGIEAPSARAAAGKPSEGTLTLEAKSDGTRAILRIRDDGAGIDVERVRAKAVHDGLWEGGRELGGSQLLDILTHAGFTTRDAADDLAGRGIGLDVVASRVRELEGQLSIETTPGRGTTFGIDVPISASTTAGLIAAAGGHRLGILLHSVERVVRVDCRAAGRVGQRLVVDEGGELVAVLRLSEFLGVADSPDGRLPGVVLRHGKRRLVLLVHEIPDEQALVVRPVPRAFSGSALVQGGAVLADGTVLPVLDVPVLFELATAGTPAQPLVGQHRRAAEGPSRGLKILVVDDSITMRTLLRNILQSAGHEVVAAHDGAAGRDAYEQLAGCDLVISDLQMPRLDGAGLCRAVRGSNRPNTPFIMVTSVDDEGERKAALQAGADAYLIKSDFEQVAFLDLVGKLTRGAPVAA